MLLSMTGYGRATSTFGDRTITVEIRSLNSKFTDVRFKIPALYREKEIELRKLIVGLVERGKIDLGIEIQSLSGEDEYGLNEALFRRYYRQLSLLKEELKIENGDFVQAILKIPNVIASHSSEIDEKEWQDVLSVVRDAIRNFTDFRTTEGKAMAEDLSMRVQTIASLLEKVDPFEKERIGKLRARMQQNLQEFMGKENVDENRFEQEVLFYLEKIDITEEKVRLGQHCKYFLQQLEDNSTQKGRKLSFISQEIGREINTLGAKGYSSEIQRIVVNMKDELEKIKEQVANLV
ncbi:MAG: YicC/YloC family endoribonuclease [Bacteroidota bacterium]